MEEIKKEKNNPYIINDINLSHQKVKSPEKFKSKGFSLKDIIYHI